MSTNGVSSTAEVLQAIRDLGEVSRSGLAKHMGVAASTISLRVDELASQGLIEEAGSGTSTGGRRPRLLRLAGGGGVVLAADLGTHHARLAILGLTGEPIEVVNHPLRIDAGPEPTVAVICSGLRELLDRYPGHVLRGVGNGIPGPVAPISRRVTAPSRMPGWHGFPVGEVLAAEFDVPIAVDNDANLLTFGDYRRRWVREGVRHVVGVKVGRGIGCGVVTDGHIYHGAVGAAGDISHVRLPGTAAPGLMCTCGNKGCLETVASGAAILAQLQAEGQPAEDLTEVVTRVQGGDPFASQLVRAAGRQIGEVMAVVVNFFNPEILLLGGVLASADPMVAAVRAAIYECCLPMASEAVRVVTAGDPDVTLAGATARVMDLISVDGL